MRAEPVQSDPIEHRRPNEDAAASPEGRELEAVLNEAVAFMRSYVVFGSDEQADAVALWVLHTYIYDQMAVTPYLAITSAEKRSGKTQLLDVLEQLVACPWRIACPSEAVVFRKIEQDHPTILLDEADAIFSSKQANTHEGLRGLLNVGYRRGSKVSRCVGEGANMKLQDFETYCPKAIAGIRDLPDTVNDRSIPIRMIRKKPEEKVKRLRIREIDAASAPLREAISQAVCRLDVSEDSPELPTEIDDRAQDCWEPLLAIADRAGGTWLGRSRRAAVALMSGRLEEEIPVGSFLLADCRTCFGDDDRVPTQELLARLQSIEESPWGDMKLTAHRLAKELRQYGIAPKQIRIGSRTMKGYDRADFKSAWERYLAPELPQATETHVDQAKQPKQAKQHPEVSGLVAEADPNEFDQYLPLEAFLPCYSPYEDVSDVSHPQGTGAGRLPDYQGGDPDVYAPNPQQPDETEQERRSYQGGHEEDMPF